MDPVNTTENMLECSTNKETERERKKLKIVGPAKFIRVCRRKLFVIKIFSVIYFLEEKEPTRQRRASSPGCRQWQKRCLLVVVNHNICFRRRQTQIITQIFAAIFCRSGSNFSHRIRLFSSVNGAATIVDPLLYMKRNSKPNEK